jgi:hypothetical protein
MDLGVGDAFSEAAVPGLHPEDTKAPRDPVGQIRGTRTWRKV